MLRSQRQPIRELEEMQVTASKVMPWQEDEGQKVVGLGPSAGKGFFPKKIMLNILVRSCYCGYCTSRNCEFNNFIIASCVAGSG